MKVLKQLLTGILLTVLIPSVGFSESDRMEKLIDELDLRPEQVDPFKEILGDHREEMKELRKEKKELKDDTHDKLSEILDGDQLRKFEEISEEEHEDRHSDCQY